MQTRDLANQQTRDFVSALRFFCAFVLLLTATTTAALAEERKVGVSPWGPADEIGRLNLITPKSRANILSRIDGRTAYDLSVEYFIGMPSWQAAGDPRCLCIPKIPSGVEIVR